jgi:hydrogenase maturation factor HypF (carbamoyltransferase family)
MNKKLLTGLIIITGVGIVYLIYKNKQNKNIVGSVKNTTEIKIPMSTESDAIAFMEALKDKGFIVKISTEQRKSFTNEYVKDITKSDHTKVLELLKKEPNKWTLEEEFFYIDKFVDNVLTLDND